MNNAHCGLRFVTTGQSLILNDLKNHTEKEFRAIWPIIHNADISFTNFEATILSKHGSYPSKNGLCHAADPSVLDTLKSIGFNALSLSNNHAFDLGPTGILSTLDEVNERGFLYAGIGSSLSSAATPGTKTFPIGKVALLAMDAGPQPEQVYAKDASNNLASRIGINPLRVDRTLTVTDNDLSFLKSLSERLGHEKQKSSRMNAGFSKAPGRAFEFYGIRFAPGPECFESREIDKIDFERNINAIKDAAGKTTFVIVYLHHHHWENDWEKSPAWVTHLAHQCIDAGANVFVSHGIPLLHGIEIYCNRPIFYSLGNFIYHTMRPKERSGDDRLWQSVIAGCDFDEAGDLIKMELIPIVLGGERALHNKDYKNRLTPHLAGRDYGLKILQKLKKLSKTHGTSLDIQDGRGFIFLDR